MSGEVNSYEDWLALSDQEREDMQMSWNVYNRECIGVPYTAAGRLAIVSDRRILDLSVGVYHGGEYVILATVSEEDFVQCPPMLSESFEGFRIVWISSVTASAENTSPIPR